jgi:hypothetical protein
MGNVRNVCLKVKKQKIISSLVTVIQVSYIMLIQSQEYNFHGMKLNIPKINMHWGVSQEKKNICNLSKKIFLWWKVPRRVNVKKRCPKNVGKHHDEEAVHLLQSVSGCSHRSIVSLAFAFSSFSTVTRSFLFTST